MVIPNLDSFLSICSLDSVFPLAVFKVTDYFASREVSFSFRLCLALSAKPKDAPVSTISFECGSVDALASDASPGAATFPL